MLSTTIFILFFHSNLPNVFLELRRKFYTGCQQPPPLFGLGTGSYKLAEISHRHLLIIMMVVVVVFVTVAIGPLEPDTDDTDRQFI